MPVRNGNFGGNDRNTTIKAANVRKQLGMENSKSKDVRKAGDDEDRRNKKTRDREGWKRLSDEAVKKLEAAPYP